MNSPEIKIGPDRSSLDWPFFDDDHRAFVRRHDEIELVVHHRLKPRRAKPGIDRPFDRNIMQPLDHVWAHAGGKTVQHADTKQRQPRGGAERFPPAEEPKDGFRRVPSLKEAPKPPKEEPFPPKEKVFNQFDNKGVK